jgi:hypothetical protein
LVLFLIRRDWENVFLTMLVLVLTLVPAFLLHRYRIYIPPEFQLVAAAFVFLSLYLGSARDFYYHFWWWDVVLHTGSGFLLGIVGFLALFLLNQTDRLPEGIRPAFLCFFGLTFAVFLGVLWEIFEFAVDMIVPGANMLSWETGAGDSNFDAAESAFLPYTDSNVFSNSRTIASTLSPVIESAIASIASSARPRRRSSGITGRVRVTL